MQKLSIIIPAYNEIKTLEEILKKINTVKIKIDKEIIIVDDFSTDGTIELVKKLSEKYKTIFHDKNKGKGAAIKSALQLVTGDYVIIQDADLEYDPNEYINLIEEIKKGKYQIVYGSRNLKKNVRFKKTYYYGGKLITFITNILYNSKLTDVNTCYKLFKTDILKSLNIEQERFSFCEEVTAKSLKRGYKIKEIPINYYPRNFDEGKKIRIIDGIKSILTLLKYRIYD